MYFEDLNLSMTMRLEKITISGQELTKGRYQSIISSLDNPIVIHAIIKKT